MGVSPVVPPALAPVPQFCHGLFCVSIPGDCNLWHNRGMSVEPIPDAEPVPLAKPVPLAPVGRHERIVTLDILRGAAVLGILLVNIQYYAFPSLEAEDWRFEGSSPADTATRYGIEFFATMKFISIFSLLFGMGLALQSDRAAARSRPFAGTYVRRLVVLMVIGLAHGTLLWYGDILLFYAVIGFIALLCRNARPKFLLISAIILLLVPLVFMGGCAAVFPEEMAHGELDWLRIADDYRAASQYSVGAESQPANDSPTTTTAGASSSEIRPPPLEGAGHLTATPSSKPSAATSQEAPPQDPALEFFAFMADEEHIYRFGTWGEMVLHRSVMFAIVWITTIMIFGWRTLAMFFLGICFIRLRILTDSNRHRRTYQYMVWIGLAIGLPMQLMAIWARTTNPDNAWGVMAFFSGLYIGSLGLFLAYVGVVALICLRSDWLARLSPLASVGRTALTNYLSHSIICYFIFYSSGLGLFGEINYPTAILIVLAIFAVQLVVSPIWLRYFKFGPFEWIWRTLTYWRLQPMRLHPAPSTAGAGDV